MQKGPLQVFFWLLAEVSRTILKKHQSKIIHLETKHKSNNTGLFKRKMSLSGSKVKSFLLENCHKRRDAVIEQANMSQNIPNIWPTQRKFFGHKFPPNSRFSSNIYCWLQQNAFAFLSKWTPLVINQEIPYNLKVQNAEKIKVYKEDC